jgi:anti-sigma factor RsiW
MVKQSFNPQADKDEMPADVNLEAWLGVAMYRQSCPEPMLLGEYQLGLLDGAEKIHIQAHLARCPHCQAELAELIDFLAEGVLPAVSSLESQSPNWVQELGFEWQRIRETGRIMIRLLGEALTPGVIQPAPIALRGHQAEPGNVLRRLILSPDQTEDLDLEVTVTQQTDHPQQGVLTIRAQVPSRWPDLAGVPVRASAGDWQAEGLTDEAGEVFFEGVPTDSINGLMIEVNP